MLIAALTTPLKYFADLAKLGNFSQAAEKNFITQSAMSQAIKRLEAQIGVELLHHDRGQCRLTSSGKLLLEQIQPLLIQLEATQEFLDELKGGKQLKLTIGCMHSIANALIPGVLSQFQKKVPGAQVDLRIGNGGVILDLVRSGEIDFGLVLDNDDLTPFATLPIREGYFEAFKAPTTTKESFLLSEPSQETNLFKQRYKHHFAKPPEVQMHVASWEVIASLTEAGVGLGYLPDYVTLKFPTLEAIRYPFPSIPYRMVGVFRDASLISDGAKYFLSLIDIK